jgi:hypothetical protein
MPTLLDHSSSLGLIRGIALPECRKLKEGVVTLPGTGPLTILPHKLDHSSSTSFLDTNSLNFHTDTVKVGRLATAVC